MKTQRITWAAGIAFGLSVSGPALAAELVGTTAAHGNGTVSSYAIVSENGVPNEIGVHFSAGALDDLPNARNGTSRCFDLNGNGVVDTPGECEGDYQATLPLPAEIANREDIPFVFAMVNWNPEGHPPEAWAPAHFDIHFYQIPPETVDSIRVGNCGIFMDCDDFQRAIKPVPAKYVNASHVSVEAAVGQMGNHLIDVTTPELGNPPAPFTHTWIFGAFDGSVIFHEVMATHAFMMLGSDTCTEIKQPEAWEKAGYYPTRYCFRHESDGGLRVFMEGFEMRPAG